MEYMVITIIVLLLILVSYLKCNLKMRRNNKMCIEYVQCDPLGNEIYKTKEIFCFECKNKIYRVPVRYGHVKFTCLRLPSCKYRLYSSDVNVKGHKSPPIEAYGLLVNTPYKVTNPGNFYIGVVH
jgi:hypothetical protein